MYHLNTTNALTDNIQMTDTTMCHKHGTVD